MPVVNLPALEAAVGESVAGRPGGAVSLAVGMAQIFSGAARACSGLMAYWYHFAIMFEALFILTTIDTGTRVARFLVQEFLGQASTRRSSGTTGCPARCSRRCWSCPAGRTSSGPATSRTIWPMFGIANQLLAAVALAVGTTIIINIGRARYAWVTLAPLCFVAITTLTAGLAQRPRQLLADGDRRRTPRCTSRAISTRSSRS